MKFLVVDDEHDLYHMMMDDLFVQRKYCVEEIKRVVMPMIVKRMHDIHYSRRVNKFFEMPGKSIWNRWYTLHNYNFEKNEAYTIIFMNGTFRQYYSRRYMEKLKEQHPNVKLCLLLFDKSIYYSAKRAINMADCFDYVFSFDEEDCKEYGFKRFYSCFSPSAAELKKDDTKQSDAFFIGNAGGRLDILQDTFRYIAERNSQCRFYITGVEKENQIAIDNVTYNKEIPFYEEMNYAYNSNCLVEVLRKGQKGISLRVCEAVAFNKKLITNNTEIVHEPFYDSRYMKIFTQPNEIDVNFLKEKIAVQYDSGVDYFSPIRILDMIVECENNS